MVEMPCVRCKQGSIRDRQLEANRAAIDRGEWVEPLDLPTDLEPMLPEDG